MARNLRIIIGKRRIYFEDVDTRGRIRYYYSTINKLRPIAKKKALKGIQQIEGRKRREEKEAKVITIAKHEREATIEKRREVFIRPYISAKEYDLNFEGEPISVDINRFLQLSPAEKQRMAVFEMHKWFKSHGSNMSDKLNKFVDYEEEANL